MPLGDRITSTSNVIGSESTVGNIDWIRQQSDVVFNFVYNDVEDFAYAARRDIEWIDEHMTELLNQETTNIPSLFKTPGRLRGVPSPRKLKSTTNKENVKPIGHVHFDHNSVKGATVQSPLHPKAKIPLGDSNRVNQIQPSAIDEEVEEQGTEPNKEYTKKVSKEDKEREGDDDSSFLAISRSIRKSNKIVNETTFMDSQPKDEAAVKQISNDLTADNSAFVSAKSSPDDTKEPTDFKIEVQELNDKKEDKDILDNHEFISEGDSDASSPPLNRSTFGFASLPVREPLTKKSFAKTPSTASRGETNGISKYKPRSSKLPTHPIPFNPQKPTDEQKSPDAKNMDKHTEKAKVEYPAVEKIEINHLTDPDEMLQPLTPANSHDKIQQQASSENKSTFIGGVFKRAKQLFFEESDKAEAKENDKGVKPSPTKSIAKTDTFSRLMAPTFSSTSKRLGSPTKMTETVNDITEGQKSPLAKKIIKPMYPEVQKISFTKTAKTLTKPRTEAKQDNSTIVDGKQDVNSSMIIESSTTIDTKSEADIKIPVKKVPSKGKLTNQRLQAKNSNSSLNSTAIVQKKPLTIKLQTAAQRELESKRKNVAKATRPAQAPPGIRTSLPQTSLTVMPQIASLKKSHDELTKENRDEAPKTLKRNMALETESKTKLRPKMNLNTNSTNTNNTASTVSSGMKRTSEQANNLESPLEKKTTRISTSSGSKFMVINSKSSNSKSIQTPANNLKKAAILRSQFKAMPHVDGVKFSSDKIRFGQPQSNQMRSVQPKLVQSQPGPGALPVQPSQNSFNRPTFATPMVNYSNHIKTPTATTVLPEILSESEDDDEGNVLQDWANSPELHQMLLRQQRVDPDSVFGPIQPLHMDEVFRTSTRLSRFRPRSSSANWTGQDKLTQQEIERYANDMGYYNPLR